MVVAAPDVNYVVHTLELIPVIGNVGSKVGVLAIGLNENAVLIVAQIGGAEPQGAFLLVEITHLVELLEGAVDGGSTGKLSLAVLDIERTLGEPDVKVAVHIMAKLFDTLEHAQVATLAELHHAVMLVGVHPFVSVGAIEVGSLVDDVGATVGVATEFLGKLVLIRMGLGMLVSVIGSKSIAIGNENLVSLVDIDATGADDIRKLHVAHGNGVSEGVHLIAVVIDVVLALDVVAGMLHHAAQGIAKGRPTTMADVHGAHGVCGDKLNLGLNALAGVAASEIHALSARLAKNGVLSGRRKVEVDETGACNLDLLDRCILGKMRHDRLGDLARRAVRKLCGLHGKRGGPLTMRRVGGTLESIIIELECGQLAGIDSGSKSIAQKLFDLLGHGSSSITDLAGS